MKAQKNQKNQIELNLEDSPRTQTSRKHAVHNILVQLRASEGEDGHTLETIKRHTGVRATKTQIRKALDNLVFDGHATAKVIAGRRRYFLGPIPLSKKVTKNRVTTTLLALKKLTGTRRNSLGYTNAEIHDYVVKTLKVALTKGQVSNATSRCNTAHLIGSCQTHGARGQRVDRFLWTYHPEAEAIIQGTKARAKPAPAPAPAPTQKPPYPKAVVVGMPDTSPGAIRQLKTLHEQTRHLIGKALMSREIPPTARTEAFALTDAFDALMGKL